MRTAGLFLNGTANANLGVWNGARLVRAWAAECWTLVAALTFYNGALYVGSGGVNKSWGQCQQSGVAKWDGANAGRR